MFEIVGNLHLHTTASDGTGTHTQVAEAAARAGLDFIIYTDHNTWVDGQEGWFQHPDTGKKLLRLMGQEINDQRRQPECNHLLCPFVCTNLNGAAADPQRLIDAAHASGGLTFLAHPIERPGYAEAAQMYPWVNWEVSGFTGLEIWNAMTDAKWRMRSIPRGLLGSHLPRWVLHAPFPEMLARWDQLLAAGQKVVAIGNSDAHAWPITWRGLTRVIFPYEFLFRAVNTHVLLPEPLAQNVEQARTQIYEALKAGRCFVSNNLVASPRGFSFTAEGGGQQAVMGDDLPFAGETVLRISSPRRAKLRLLRNGAIVAAKTGTELVWRAAQPGVYRAEAHRWYWGWTRGWVYTNPIYIR
ncbi:MAG: hypothetical protein D6768_03130 [Chloroflexi bacterium]|nr:MAG: hypothetical protein D6768_03130 [Chloroflexota bacterium]